jgi:hypothetical protein
MSLIDDLKTFLMALALGVVITVSINYVVVNYTEGPAPVQAAVHDEANEYKAPSPVQKTDTSVSYGAYY